MGLHGKPDWGLQLKSTVYSMDDLSELAVRLGSISQFDRRGDIIFQDDFENGLGKWNLYGRGEGNERKLSATMSKSGGYCIRLIAGSDDLKYSYMKTYFPYPVLSKMGLEAHLCEITDVDRIEFIFYTYTGTQLMEAHIRYDRTNQKLQYIDYEGNPQDIATSFSLYTLSRLFHVFKMVFDLENNKYHRLIVNETTYDLSAYNLYTKTVTGSKHIEINIYVYSINEGNGEIFIDNVIVTQNEP